MSMCSRSVSDVYVWCAMVEILFLAREGSGIFAGGLILMMYPLYCVCISQFWNNRGVSSMVVSLIFRIGRVVPCAVGVNVAL